jgi:hypothetical protein
MVVNDSTPGNDTGANGVAFFRTSGNILISDNTVSGNRAPSIDYGYDGGAFEIFGSSNITMSDNLVFDNQNILETGTNSGYVCANNVFTRNVAYGGNDKSLVSNRGPMTQGILLRCAQNMLIANNTISDIDHWIYCLNLSSSYSSGVEGLRIVNNINAQVSAQVYAIDFALPASIEIDGNLDWVYGGGNLGTYQGTRTSSLATFRTLTGRQAAGVQAEPAFVDRTARDYRVGPSSPAIDAALALPGITDGFLGAAADIGRFEAR